MSSQGRRRSGVLLGIDLGGTQIKAARFGPGARREATARVGSAERKGPADLIDALRAETAGLLSAEDELEGIGLGVAGVLDPSAGLVLESPNIPCLNGTNLRKHIREAFGGVAVRMMNDANAAALGEFHAGAGAEYDSMALLTLGTGIGGGIVIDGRLWEGAAGIAGEVGHMCIQTDGPLCHCGAVGCLEACVSGWALVRDAKEIGASNPSSEVNRLAEITPRALAEVAQKGDEDILALWERAGKWLGVGIANLMNLLNPGCIVLAGGLAQAGDLLLGPARRSWEEHAFERAHSTSPVLLGTMGEWAGVRGAIQPFLDEARRAG